MNEKVREADKCWLLTGF